MQRTRIAVSLLFALASQNSWQENRMAETWQGNSYPINNRKGFAAHQKRMVNKRK